MCIRDRVLAQLTHQLDVADYDAESFAAAMAQGETIRAYQPGYPWVVNNDPCITGITFNTAVEPFNNREVRWALVLAIDIVEYLAQAVEDVYKRQGIPSVSRQCSRIPLKRSTP